MDKNFSALSLTGMTMSARKRAARFDSRGREEYFGKVPSRQWKRTIINLWHLGNGSLDVKKLDKAIAFVDKEPTLVNDAEYAHGHIYAKKRAKYRIGEKLKPCHYCRGPELFDHCKGKRIAEDVAGEHRRGECVFCRTCEDAKLTLRFFPKENEPQLCDGSGVMPARKSYHE